MRDQAVFQLQLVPVPSSVPPEIRMRRALKSLLRQFGFRCVDYRELPVPGEHLPQDATRNPKVGQEANVGPCAGRGSFATAFGPTPPLEYLIVITYLLSERTSNMKPEHKQILVECLRRMEELAATPRPGAWKVWETRPLDEQLEHGPRYGSGEWFGAIADHERMRFRRALADLEHGGLLTTWKRWGRRLTNIQLTAEGETVARELQAAEAVTG